MIRALLLCCLPLTAFALEVAGVAFPERLALDEQELVLNGVGLREYGILGIDVYVAALYLPARETDATRILEAQALRVVRMHLLRDVSRDDTLRAWDVYFTKNCLAPCTLPAAAISAFHELLPDTRSDDIQTYRFFPDHVAIDLNGTLLGRVRGAAFSRLLLSTWIGEAPTTEKLKAELLGIRIR